MKERIEDVRHSESLVSDSTSTATESSVEKPTGELESVNKKNAAPKSIRPAPKAGWLQPIALEVSEKQPGMQAVAGIQTAARRPSNKGCLPMRLGQYRTLVDLTGRQLRTDKRGRIPPELAAILQRLQCSGESWVDLIRNCRKRFRREAGLAASLASFQERRQSRRRNSAMA